ncbi:LamG domain-containing protein [Streptomyces sp. NBC_00328]|uniref:LamG domain-containing protein n=1 Tax=Streptomyces sp. NBC_00328 TaxID=2903646 RepID=UPI002E29F01F|nr:LamG domain-containing protein [Streptomyces sp. NBC_00328]
MSAGNATAADEQVAATPAAQATTPEAKAATVAAESGQRVEVAGRRTETSQVFANPDGTFTQDMNAAPVRAQQPDGLWAPIDTDLERSADGSVRAKSTTAALTLSGGGNKNLVTLSQQGRTLSLGWASELPKPQLDGSSAVYADVLPGVDLKLTAVATGFSQVLVVKTPEAAANPDLNRLEMSVQGSGVQVEPGRDGGLSAVDENGQLVFESPVGRMWDSSGDSPVEARTAAFVSEPSLQDGDGEEDDPGRGPDADDKTGDVSVSVSPNALTLTPDLDLLRGKDTVFPVYIDPPVKGVVRTDWTALSSDGDRFWEWDGDKGTGYCSNYAGYLCSYTPYTQRLYYEYPLTSLYGKKVLDVTLEAYQTWTFTCDAHWYDLSLVDKGISSSTDWAHRPAATDLMGDRNVAYGRGGLCTPSQPADWVRFSDNVGDETNENLTPTVRDFVEDQKSQITFSLTAHDEDSTGSWARFRDDAKLSVTYISNPSVPTPVGVQQGTTGSVCNASTQPFATSATKPKMYATVQSADGGNAQLRAQFEVWKADGSTKVWSADSPTSEWVADNAKRDATTSSLAAQTDYRMHARTQAYYKTDRGTTGTITSSWSSWCYFRVDTDSPPPPVVTSTDNKYLPADENPASGGVGESGAFKFTPGDTDATTPGLQSDVTSYKWKLNSGKVSDPIKVTKGASLARTITPNQAGENTIQVWGFDDAGHTSLTGYYSFAVKGAELPTGTWHLDNNGNDSTTATPHALTPAATAAYSILERGGTHSLKLDGTSGYAATSGAVLDTSKSFAVSAWVRLQDDTRNYTVLSQAGANASGLQLYYSSTYKAWIFNRQGSDVTSPVITRSISAKPPTLNVWTHLAGVYDAAGETIQLYVNGQPQGEPVSFKTPWNATGALQVGRLRSSAAYSEYFDGRIDEVHVWSRALADTEVIQDSVLEDEDASDGTAGDPMVTVLGNWDATTATGTTITDQSGYGRTMTLNGATLDTDPDMIGNEIIGLPTRQVMALNGSTNYATAMGPMVDDTGSFTTTAWVRLDGTKLADNTKTYKVQVLGQPGTSQSSWGVWYEQPAGSSVGKWYFGRPDKEATGAAWTRAQSEVAATDTWVRLTVVYNAQQSSGDESDDTKRGALFLYVNTQQIDGDQGVPYTAPWQGSGQFEVGRAKIDGAAARYFPGHIASVRVWAGAMSATQIGNLYATEQ